MVEIKCQTHLWPLCLHRKSIEGLNRKGDHCNLQRVIDSSNRGLHSIKGTICTDSRSIADVSRLTSAFWYNCTSTLPYCLYYSSLFWPFKSSAQYWRWYWYWYLYCIRSFLGSLGYSGSTESYSNSTLKDCHKIPHSGTSFEI